MPDNPTLIEVTRGDMVESHHRGAFCLANDRGEVKLEVGDTSRFIYPRSAIKPLQAMHLIHSGAADHFHLADKKIALAASSHSGEEYHCRTINEWLADIELDSSALECGGPKNYSLSGNQFSLSDPQIQEQILNNCSGKHVGFLTIAKHKEWNFKNYIDINHPIQKSIISFLSPILDLDLNKVPVGVDGCGIPVFGMPLRNLASAFARFGTGNGLPSQTKYSAARVYQAMVNEPLMVAGRDRFCTRAISAGCGQLIVKTGAEGVYCASFPETGLGVALKIDDGSSRAAESLMCVIASAIVDISTLDEVQDKYRIATPIRNVEGVIVGHVRPTTDFVSQLVEFSAW